MPLNMPVFMAVFDDTFILGKNTLCLRFIRVLECNMTTNMLMLEAIFEFYTEYVHKHARVKRLCLSSR